MENSPVQDYDKGPIEEHNGLPIEHLNEIQYKEPNEVPFEETTEISIEEPSIELAKKQLLAQLDLVTEQNDTVSTEHSFFEAANQLDENNTVLIADQSVIENMETEMNTRELNDKINDIFSSVILALDIREEFKSFKDNYTKGCKWSPDGLCLLVPSEDKHVRIYNLPDQIATGNFQSESWFCSDHKQFNKSAIDIHERELIYDYAWYPLMDSNNRQTCCFATTCRDMPIHLWDAWTGDLICSYSHYNHLDQLTAAHSLGFSINGSMLFAGFKKKICVFEVSRPGRNFISYDVKDQKGILSCFASHPQLESIFACGSYNGSVGFYSHKYKRHFMRLEGHKGGVTQIMFSNDGTKLYSGARMDNEIICWDVRNPGKVLHSFVRKVETNQRIQFDLDPNNNFLVSGTTDNMALLWNLNGLTEHEIQPTSYFSPHNDCVNGITIHPSKPILATSSGQRHSPLLNELGSDNEDTCSDDTSVKIWYFGAS